MHQLPRDIWNNHLIPYFSDADFVHLVTTCRTYYNEFSGYKRMGACYNVSQIYRVVDRYDFSNVIYDLKIFRPEYLPQNLNTIQLWKLPKTIGQGIPEIISHCGIHMLQQPWTSEYFFHRNWAVRRKVSKYSLSPINPNYLLPISSGSGTYASNFFRFEESYYQISRLPNSLTRLELDKLSGQLRHLTINNTPYLVELMIPNYGNPEMF
jgi:hypothetical protein